MKINLQELPKLFQSHIAKSTQMNRKNCPSPKILSECLQGQASKKNKNTVIEHITHCKFCLEEFQFILEIRREKKKLIQKVSNLYIKPSKNIKTKSVKVHSSFFQKTWKWAFFAASTFIVLTLIVFIKGGLNQKFRGTGIDYIRLIQSTHNKATKASIEFHWEKMENVEYYIIELFDNTLLPIWKSQQIPNNRASLPNDIMESLTPGENYYWFITGFFPGEAKIESSLERFQIKK